MTFLAAAAFHWVNPKARAMALTAVTVYAPPQTLGGLTVIAVAFGLVNLPCVGSWAMLGQQMRRLLTKPGRLRALNVVMAMLLVVSLWPVVSS